MPTINRRTASSRFVNAVNPRLRSAIVVPQNNITISNENEFVALIDEFSNNYVWMCNPHKGTLYLATAVTPQLMSKVSYSVSNGVMTPELQQSKKKSVNGFLVMIGHNIFTLLAAEDVGKMVSAYDNVGTHISAAEVKTRGKQAVEFVHQYYKQSADTDNIADTNKVISDYASFAKFADSIQIPIYTAKHMEMVESFSSFMTIFEEYDHQNVAVRTRAIVLTNSVVRRFDIYYTPVNQARPIYIDQPGVLLCTQTLPHGDTRFAFIAKKPRVLNSTHKIMQVNQWLLKPHVAGVSSQKA